MCLSKSLTGIRPMELYVLLAFVTSANRQADDVYDREQDRDADQQSEDH